MTFGSVQLFLEEVITRLVYLLGLIVQGVLASIIITQAKFI